jgi:hypothetical protein
MDKRSFPIHLVIESGDPGRMTNTTEASSITQPTAPGDNDSHSHSARVVYDFLDGALWIHIMSDGRKGRNLARNPLETGDRSAPAATVLAHT